MSEVKTPAIKTPASIAAVYGLFFGLIMILEFMLSYTLNIDPLENPAVGWVMNLLNYLFLPFVFIMLACNAYKKYNNGFISFGQCIKAGVTTAFLAALAYGVFYFVFTLIFPEFIDEAMDKVARVTMRNSPDLTQEQLDMSLSWVRKFMEPMLTIPFTLVMYTIIGLIHSFIVGAIVKKDQPQFN
ncbi:DUF4199 domain-containing protein [Flavobacterium silvaticum]|uniref:DUF4199 domain-containing protein n=1 Tax=Flavobacterium silvaticum TaxID=1852020 RepID=A0A972JIC8_9FLAO|nr:DUF4199 domain-containing protein [Flavobacterium silvaticum]NMH28078.1 DUF4199 domain-containing protein [Flavobacterium silvaticum]